MNTNIKGNFQICISVPLNKIVHIKKNYVRGNQMPFMTKEFSKEITARSRPRDNYSIDKKDENRFL